MPAKNRDLSQFGSFIYVDNSNQEIGITTSNLPYVGIGTTNPQVKLDVVGDAKVSGVVTASSFSGSGYNLTGIVTSIIAGSGISIASSNGISTITKIPSSLSQILDSGNTSSLGMSVGVVTATSFVRSGGTSSQFLKADGSVDTNTYITSSSSLNQVLGAGNTSSFGMSVGVVTATAFYLNGSLLISADTASWSTSGSNVYRSSGSVGIGSTIPAYTLDVAGQTQATRFRSTEPLGGASPLVVQSQTLVANLNANYLSGKTAPSGDIVGTTDNQTLSSKTINLSSNTLSGTLSQFNAALSDDDFVSLTGTETLTNKTLSTPVITSIRTSIGNTQTVPTGIGTLVSTNSVGIITGGMLGVGIITSGNISAGASITNGQLANSTISGVSLGSTLSSLYPDSTFLAASIITGNSVGLTTFYNGSITTYLTVKADSGGSDPTGYPIVSRASDGSFSAGNSGTITAKDFNSTSDENLKTNIKIVENGLETVKSLRGVNFDWKIDGKSSIGIIAQELEKVLPELVSQGEVKTVNYNGLVGVLIEAIKELSAEVEELKDQLNK